jgi:hypothetical protein
MQLPVCCRALLPDGSAANAAGRRPAAAVCRSRGHSVSNSPRQAHRQRGRHGAPAAARRQTVWFYPSPAACLLLILAGPPGPGPNWPPLRTCLAMLQPPTPTYHLQRALSRRSLTFDRRQGSPAATPPLAFAPADPLSVACMDRLTHRTARSSCAASALPTTSRSRSPSILGRQDPAPSTPTRPASPASASQRCTQARLQASSTPSPKHAVASLPPASTSTRALGLRAALMGRTRGWHTNARSTMGLLGAL